MIAHGGSVHTEFRHQLIGRIGVVDIVVAQLLALKLLAVATPGRASPVDIERRRLVRVLAVAQRLAQRAREATEDGAASPSAPAYHAEIAAS